MTAGPAAKNYAQFVASPQAAVIFKKYGFSSLKQ
jgi:ABC-type molybdate transport system substrate-binding protein